ncbi:MAG: DUF3025 domain-containing protein [Proteobacteria bacterium]|nr:DUF3025 domain-containing protein [Pseudomonadota bacterium]
MFKEQINKKDIWNPYFYKHFAGFASITPFLEEVGYIQSWPTLAKYNAFALSYLPQNNISEKITFVAQDENRQYEQQIFHQHQIPTRLNVWHDFFNNVSWIVFPKLKWAMIKRYCQEKTEFKKTRTPLQNVLAHFDECGMVICTDSQDIVDKIQAFDWKALFCQTPNLQQHCLPVFIGHGLMEKGLSPYVGMTAKVIILKVDQQFFTLSTKAQNKKIDNDIASYIECASFPCDPKLLQPFPLLGWPNWHALQSEEFYNNTHYFRARKISDGQNIVLT